MADKYLLFLTFLQIFNAIKTELPEGVTIDEINNCTALDFQSSDCTLKCQLYFEDEANGYHISGAQWLYSIDDTMSEIVTIFDGSSCSSNSDDNYECSLLLTNEENFTSTNYYAGYYWCNYKITDTANEIQYEDQLAFKIDDSEDGTPMGKNCDTASECLALDAQCTGMPGLPGPKCKCVKPNDISYTDENDNVACLSASRENGPCNINEQCGNQLAPLSCYNQVCTPISLLTPCENDDVCAGTTVNSHCDDGQCYCVQPDSVSTDLKKCDELPVSITKDGSTTSTLSCTATVPNTNYKLTAFQWTYKSFRNSSDNATIFDGNTQTIDATSYKEKLSLGTYNSGYYFCQFKFLSEKDNTTVEVNAAFQLVSTDGASMGGTCAVSEDCAALNAICNPDSHICACMNDYSVQYSEAPDSPACLSMKGEGEDCNTDTQCIQADQNMECVAAICTCTGAPTYIAEIGKTLCIIPAPYGTGCHYDEQCTLSHDGTACNNLICGCADDREYSDSTFTCEKVLSGGAIAGIVIGCLVGVAAIVVLIICFVRK